MNQIFGGYKKTTTLVPGQDVHLQWAFGDRLLPPVVELPPQSCNWVSVYVTKYDFKAQYDEIVTNIQTGQTY
jgi:hypothetical protein